MWFWGPVFMPPSYVIHFYRCPPNTNTTLASAKWFSSLTLPLLPPPQTVSLQELQQDFETPSPIDPNNNQTPANGAGISYITFSPNTSSATPCEPPASAESLSEPSDTLASVPPFVTFHTLILDMSGVSFVDLMGIKALAKVRPQGVGGGPISCSLGLLFSGPSFQQSEGGYGHKVPSFPQM